MFDIGFWEIAIIGVVALLVVGPERLPGLARTAGHWVGRLRRFLASVKTDIEKEVRAEELQRVLNKQNEFKDVYDIVEETRDEVGKASSQVTSLGAELDKRSDEPGETGESTERPTSPDDRR